MSLVPTALKFYRKFLGTITKSSCRIPTILSTLGLVVGSSAEYQYRLYRSPNAARISGLVRKGWGGSWMPGVERSFCINVFLGSAPVCVAGYLYTRRVFLDCVKYPFGVSGVGFGRFLTQFLCNMSCLVCLCCLPVCLVCLCVLSACPSLCLSAISWRGGGRALWRKPLWRRT